MKITLWWSIAIILLSTSCHTSTEVRELKLAHGLDRTHAVHIAMKRMAELVDDYSQGKLRISIYPSQQLGAERELLELLQIGAVDITKTSAAVIENFSPKMQVLSLPYLFRNDQHERSILDGEIGKEILLSGTPYYLRGLTFYDAGKRSFYTVDRKVNSPKDLQGLKIRVQASKTAIQLMREFGAAATPIPFGELYTALQQGVVDGAENNPPSFYLTRHYEVCKYYILDEHTSVPDVLLMSEHTWQKLSNQEKEWVQKAANESAVYQRELWKASEEEALSKVTEAGIEIIRPDKDLFAQKVEGLAYELLSSDDLVDLYDRIKSYDD